MTTSKLNYIISCFFSAKLWIFRNYWKRNIWMCQYKVTFIFACAFVALSGREEITDQGRGRFIKPGRRLVW